MTTGPVEIGLTCPRCGMASAPTCHVTTGIGPAEETMDGGSTWNPALETE